MGFDRRTFIQLSVGGTVGILFTPVPWKVLDDVSIWTQNWPWIPKLKYGALIDKPAVSKLCDSGCAVKIRTVAGAAFGTEGNDESPLSKGGICPICANGVQVMRSPNRIKGPLKKVGDSFEPLSWDEAKGLLVEKLGEASGSVACISGDQTGTVNEVLSGFLAGLGSEDFLQMPCDMQAASRAFNGVMGGSGQVAYDLEQSDFVLLAGADALESWGPTVANHKAFAQSHRTGEEATSTYVLAGPVQTRTASVADGWVPVPEEGMPTFLLGIAYHLIKAGKTSNATDFNAFKSLVMSGYSPAKVEVAIGVDAGAIASLAKQLLLASKPLVIPGGTSVATATAAFAVNALLGSLKAAADFPKAVEVSMSPAERMSKDLLAWANKGANPAVTFVYEANPAYLLPDNYKTEFLVSFSSSWDETAQKADLILPNAFTYERCDDLATPYGFGKQSYTAGVPACKPALDVMPSADFILALAVSMDIDLGFENFAEVIAAKAEALGAEFDEEAGSQFEGTAALANVSALGASILARAASPVRGAGEFVLAPYSQLIVGSQKVATTPNAPCAISNSLLQSKKIVAMVCGVTAKKLGVSEGSKIKLSGSSGEAVAFVKVNEGVLPGAVAVPLGFGHTVGDEFSKGVGDNMYKILTGRSEVATGATVWSGSTVNIAKI